MKNFISKIIKRENFLPLLVVFVFAILASRTLIFEKGYFNMHDDLQMMRQLEMEKCFLDGQIPCRWVPDMGYGYGFPLFDFYPPLPYLVGEIFRVMQFSFVNTVKLDFALAIILSGITMYYLAKEFFGKWGGIISSVFYIWAPYHAVDIYVRGEMAEGWAMIWFPFILWASYKLMKSDKKRIINWILGLAVGWAGLLLTHNLMAMIFMPVFAVWCFIFWIKERDYKKVLYFFTSGVIALGLSSFFTLPAVLEQKYIHIATLTQGYYEYIAHYATINQLLFSRFWGYGASVWGPNDGMSFQVGIIYWVLSLILIVFGILFFVNKKKNKIDPYILYVLVFSIVFAWFAAFMAHQDSTFIWKKIPILAFVQFPWRFISLVILGFSIAAGSIAVFIKNKFVYFLVCIFLVILNWNYFLPKGGKMGELTDAQKFSGVAWNLQRTAGIYDYLPLTADENPKAPQTTIAKVMNGEGRITKASQGTDWAKFDTNLTSNSTIRINLFQFPVWKILIDGKPTKASIPTTEKWGRMYINIPSGTHSVFLKLQNTPLRNFANTISLVSWVILLTFLLWRNKLVLKETS